jgi:hypothetical protein
MHAELSDEFQDIAIMSGPNWLLNIVLWARGLTSAPVLGVGGGFQYFLSGGPPYGAAGDRAMLMPILRRAKVAEATARSGLTRPMRRRQR